ncbi:MAG: nascent polypeptide-associated complex protein [Nanoarchaeota archaeon]|nr:nascent polypeptide-associated complex protein [Nanoarchaeota archaeon]
MFPGMGKIDPKKMQAMMRQMGISQEEIEATRVIIEKQDSKIIIENPSIQRVTMSGQETWQIAGDATEEPSEERTNEEDIKLIIEKTGATEKEAKKALEESGDIAEAILKLS